jgi:hypothetical protein
MEPITGILAITMSLFYGSIIVGGVGAALFITAPGV